MLERPELWRAPEEYEAERRLTFRLYVNRHWTFVAPDRSATRSHHPSRVLRPEIKEWLDSMGFPHKRKLMGGGQSRIIFEQEAHAVLFKLTWM